MSEPNEEVDETEELDEAEENESGEENDNAEEWTPPTKAEYTKIQRQLKRANTEAKKAKEAAKEAPKPDDLDAVRAQAIEDANKRANTRIARAEARAQLASAGAKGDVSRLIKLIDFEDVDVNDDDEVFGLEDQISELKTEYPDLFNTGKAKSDARTRGEAAQKPGAPGKPASSASIIAQALRAGK